MMLKTDSGYLDFDGDVEMERQVKLFEDVKETWGDFSYTFKLAKTEKNLSYLGLPLPDNKSKLVYNKINAELLSESGEVLYKGFLRVEKVNTVIETSFYAGNNNWLNLLTGNMTELELSQYDQDLTKANIVTRFSATDGIVFPLADSGTLISRSFSNAKTEDFVGCFYLKTLFKEVFRQSGLKITGELLDDPLYNKIIVATNTRSKIEVDRNSIYVGKNGSQTVIGTPVTPATATFNLQTDPYFIGDSASFTSNTTYTAATAMIVDVEATIVSDVALLVGIFSSNGGSPRSVAGVYASNASISARNVKLIAGDTLRVTMTGVFAGPDRTITGGSFKVTPRFIYKAFGSSSVPLWTKDEFVSNILSMFNVITDFDPYSKTVTLDFFNRIKQKTALDISSYIEVTDTDYVEFISSYGRNTTLSYQESSDEDLREYNIATFNKYGAGVIEVDNDFIEESVPVVESDFSAPLSYIHPAFDSSMERFNFVELEEEGDEQDITGVTNSAGTAQFNITDADDFFQVDDLVRIKTSEVSYNGEWVIDQVTSTYIAVRGPFYDINATGTAVKLIHNLTTDDSVYLLINSGIRDVSDFSRENAQIYIDGTNYSQASLGFFNLIKNDTVFNQDFKQSLSFGPITDPLFYQRTLIDTYWGTVDRVLNDPVKLTVTAHLPEHIYRRITPLTPVTIKTIESVNTYYAQRITGYKGAHRPCEIELIKLP